MTWSLEDIKKLKATGRIRDYKISPKIMTTNDEKSCTPPGRKVTKHFSKRSKEKDFISWNLLTWCQERNLELQEEYRFHPERKWRFDWAVPELKIAIEYNGIMSQKSRHTTVTGYTGDMKKLNAAQALGWKVLQFTPLNYKELFTELNKCYEQR